MNFLIMRLVTGTYKGRDRTPCLLPYEQRNKGTKEQRNKGTKAGGGFLLLLVSSNNSVRYLIRSTGYEVGEQF